MADLPTVLVTGAASGIGAATAALLRRAGANVIPADVRPLAGGLRLDLGDPASIDAAVADLPDRLDSVVNVAGIPGPEPAVTVVSVNFLGTRMLTEKLFGRIADGGSIVNVSSQAGRGWQRRAEVVNGLLDTPDVAAGLAWCEEQRARWVKDPYTFSKQCVSAWTLRLAGRDRGRGVRVNCVSPGPVDSPLTQSFRDQIGAEQFDWSVRQVGRLATPDDIAEVIEYLAIGRCRWVNGADVVVDGGLAAGLQAGWIDGSSSPAVRAKVPA